MKTYAAMPSPNEVYVRSLRESAYPHLLTSFAFHKHSKLASNLGHEVNLMLDSGAHSAWTRGLTVSLTDYIDFARACQQSFPALRVTNLDVIPGEKGRSPDRAEAERAVAQSVENAETIRAAGLRVIEVHHFHDPLDALDGMVARRRPGELLGIGGLNAVKVAKEEMTRAYGDAFFLRLRDLCGWHTLPPVHGFGVSVASIGYRYPLASIDASSWTIPYRFGRVLDKQGKQVKSSPHLRDRDVAVNEITSVLAQWRKRERMIRELWRSRGVKVIDEQAEMR